MKRRPRGRWVGLLALTGALAWLAGSGRLWFGERPLPHHTFPGDGERVSSLAFSPDGDLLAGRTAAGALRVWDVRARALRHTWPPGEAAFLTLPFWRGGELLAWEGEGRLTVLDPATGQRVGEILLADGGFPRGWEALGEHAASGDGERFAALFAGTDEQQPGLVERWTAVVWRVETGEQLLARRIDGGSWPHWVALSADGSLLAFGDYGNQLRIWEVSTGRALVEIGRFDDEEVQVPMVQGLAFSPDGALLAVGNRDGPVQLREATTGRLIRELEGNASAGEIVFTPDGRWVIALSWFGAPVRAWDAATGKLRWQLEGEQAEVTALALSPNGRTLATGYEDGRVRLWRLR